MDCRNHPGISAANRCAGCAEPFCANCLVPIHGQMYCGSCKVLALQGHTAPPALSSSEPTVPCKTANEALTCAIVGLFCFGIILEPIAIVKAIKARKEIAADPNLQGSGKAMAALIMGIVILALWVLGIIAKISTL